jgi:hypothetical protein
MKPFLLLLVTFQSILALQVPTIKGLVAFSDTSVQVSWHSNDPAVTGFYILRIDPYMSFSWPIDTIAATESTYIDIPLQPAETYGYGVAAFSPTASAFPTTFSFITLPGIRRIFNYPDLLSSWDTVSSKIQVKIKDNSTIETGYKVLKAQNFGPFSEVASLVSANPALMDTIVFTDNTVQAGSWYIYRVIVFNSTQKYTSETTIYAYPKGQARTRKKLSLGSKVSDFSVRLGSWALKQGDTICVRQNGVPLDSCLLINVADKNKPVFAGRIRDRVPSFPQTPESYVSLDNTLLYRNMTSMVLYRFTSGVIDSICTVPAYQINFMGLSATGGQVIGKINKNTLLARYFDKKYVYHGFYFISQDTLVYLGTDPLLAAGFCTQYTFLMLQAGRAYEYFVTGFQNGSNCDLSAPVQQYYFSYDYFFNPLTPGQNPVFPPPLPKAPDTTVREIEGYLTQDSLIKKSKVVFIDSARSLVFLFGDTMMSVYSFSFETGVSKQFQTPVNAGNTLSIIYHPSARRLTFSSSGLRSGLPTMVRLYSSAGKLLFSRNAGRERSVLIPGGICGMVIAKVVNGNEKAEKKVFIIK